MVHRHLKQKDPVRPTETARTGTESQCKTDTLPYDKPTAYQKCIASRLRIDIRKDTRAVAAARIEEALLPAIRIEYKSGPASLQQIRFAQSLGIAVSQDSFLVAFAKIEEELFARNKAKLESMKLKPGDKVVKRDPVSIDGKQHELVTEFIVSSIQPNCRVFFKGGNGQSAWPAQLEKVTTKGHLRSF